MYDAVPAKTKKKVLAAQYFITADAPYSVFVQAFKVKIAEQLKTRLQEMDESFVQMGEANPTLVVRRLLAELQDKVDQDVSDLRSTNVPNADMVNEYAAAKATFQQMKDNLPFLSPAGMSEGLPPGMDTPDPEVVFKVLLETYESFAALCDKVTDAADNDAAAAAGNDNNEAQQGEEPLIAASETLADQPEEGSPSPTEDQKEEDAGDVVDNSDLVQEGNKSEAVGASNDELAIAAVDSSGEALGDEVLTESAGQLTDQPEEGSPPAPEDQKEEGDAVVVANADNDDSEAQQGEQNEGIGAPTDQAEEGSSLVPEDQKKDDAVTVGDNDDNEAQPDKEIEAAGTLTDQPEAGLPSAVVDQEDVAAVADNDDLPQQREEMEATGILTDQLEEGSPNVSRDQKEDDTAVTVADNDKDEAQPGEQNETTGILTDQPEEGLPPPTEDQKEDDVAVVVQEGKESEAVGTSNDALTAAAVDSAGEALGDEVLTESAGQLTDQPEDGSPPAPDDQKEEGDAVVVDNDDNGDQQAVEPQTGVAVTSTAIDETEINDNSTAVVMMAVDGDIVVEQIESTNGEPSVPIPEETSVKDSDALLSEPTEEASLFVADKLIEEVVEEICAQINVEHDEKPNVPLDGSPMISELIPVEASSLQPVSTQPTSSPMAPLTTSSAINVPPKNNLPSEAEREALLSTLDFSNPQFLRYAFFEHPPTLSLLCLYWKHLLIHAFIPSHMSLHVFSYAFRRLVEIGIEFGKRQFYWIAAKSLQDPLPDEWQEFEADEGDLLYLTLPYLTLFKSNLTQNNGKYKSTPDPNLSKTVVKNQFSLSPIFSDTVTLD